MAAILGIDTSASPDDIVATFRKIVNRLTPGIFDWVPAKDDMQVRLKSHAGAAKAAARAEAEREPHFLFPDGRPHSLRGLVEKGPHGIGELLIDHRIRRGSQLLFVEPRSIVEYRGVPNEPIISLLHAIRNSEHWQLIALTWVGTDSLDPRFATMHQRAATTLAAAGLHGVPVIAVAGSRVGLATAAQLIATAFETSAVLLNRGKDVLEATFSSRYLKPLASFVGDISDAASNIGMHDRVSLWSYASQSTRSTSSAGFSSREQLSSAQDIVNNPETAAEFAATIWHSVADRISSVDSTKMRERSSVLVDTADIVIQMKAAKSGSTPLKSIDEIIKDSGAPTKLPADRSIFPALVGPGAESAVTAMASQTVFPAAGLLVGAALVSSSVTFDAWVVEQRDILCDLASSSVEQARMLDVVSHVFDQGWVQSGNKQSILRVLKALYDEDVIEDEAVFRWEQSNVKSTALAKAAPFIEWLRENEEDDDVCDDDGNS